jgi:hypothetical protein
MKEDERRRNENKLNSNFIAVGLIWVFLIILTIFIAWHNGAI